MLPRTQIPNLAELGEKLGFGDSKNRPLKELTDSTHEWRRQYVCSTGMSGVDLLEWKEPVTQDLTAMTKGYLEEGGYAERWWPHAADLNAEGTLQYERDQDQIVQLLNMVFWRQNIYSARNAKRWDVRRQRQSEEVESSHETLSAEKVPSNSSRPPRIGSKNPKTRSKRQSPSSSSYNSLDDVVPQENTPPRLSPPVDGHGDDFGDAIRLSNTPRRLMEANPTQESYQPRNGSSQPNSSVVGDEAVQAHQRSLSEATIANVCENFRNGVRHVPSPRKPVCSHDIPSRNVLMLKYQKSQSRAEAGSHNGNGARVDHSPDRFLTPDLSFVHEFFASKDGEDGCDGDHPLLIQEDRAAEQLDTPRRSSKRKRSQNLRPGAVSNSLYFEATRSDSEDGDTRIVQDRTKLVKRKPTGPSKKTTRSTPKNQRRSRASKSHATPTHRKGTDKKMEHARVGEIGSKKVDKERSQPHAMTATHTSSEGEGAKQRAKADTEPTAPAPKPVISVYFFFVKARKPRLVLQRWPEGKFRGKTLDFVFEAASRMTGRGKIELLRCTLFTAEKELEEVLQSGANESFETVKELFNEEMTNAFKKNRNGLKRFEIYIEPIDCDDLTKDGDSVIEDAEMGDW